MARQSLRIILRTISLVGALFAAPQLYALDSSDSNTTVRVRLEAKPEPVRAVGIVFSATSSMQFSETTINKIGDKLYEISFAVPRSVVKEESVATALGFDQTGLTSFANVIPVLSSDGRDLLASIPECPGEDGSRVATVASPGTLQQLIDVRNERMNIVRFKLARLMDSDFLLKLQKFEEAFGFKHASPLSPELPPAELIDRLSRIQHAVRKYQMYKPKPSK
jgi:hypothetical protein